MEASDSIYINAETVFFEREAGLLQYRQPYKLIDLFSGAGGLTLGFTQPFGHNFVPVWANDNNKDAVATYNANFGNHCTCDDIVGLLSNEQVEIPQADVVIGGPPCQGFSLLNKNKQNDARKQLWDADQVSRRSS